MGFKFMHVGVPTVTVQPNETYVEPMKIYKTEVVEPFNIEYIRFQDGTPFPEIMHMNPHVAYEVDCIKEASEGAEVIVEPIDIGAAIISFIVKDNVIFELYQKR